jgi:Leucine-rich repeat (LRR) protein
MASPVANVEAVVPAPVNLELSSYGSILLFRKNLVTLPTQLWYFFCAPVLPPLARRRTDPSIVARLRDLDVSCNPLAELPASLAMLIQLRALSCAGCKLSSLPSLAPLRSLRSLDLARNDFIKAPQSLSELVALETLGRIQSYVGLTESGVL